jgi:hypothetical protein
VESQIQAVTAAALIEKGYALAAGQGEIVISVGAGRREFEVHDAVDDDVLPEDLKTDFVDGCLVIDAFDVTRGVRVWHGTTSAQIDTDHANVERLKRALANVLSPFPAARELAP